MNEFYYIRGSKNAISTIEQLDQFDYSLSEETFGQSVDKVGEMVVNAIDSNVINVLIFDNAFSQWVADDWGVATDKKYELTFEEDVFVKFNQSEFTFSETMDELKTLVDRHLSEAKEVLEAFGERQLQCENIPNIVSLEQETEWETICKDFCKKHGLREGLDALI